MTQRIDFYSASPDAMKAMMAFEVAISKMGIEKSLLELIKLRASQINGCGFCVDMHTTDMRKAGETERRIATVCVWRETPFFTERERAVLAWTESLTLIAKTGVPDVDYEGLAALFSPKEMVDISLAICTINCWNRLAVGFRKHPSL
jgi:AhpD family alkylhydroperoxidase